MSASSSSAAASAPLPPQANLFKQLCSEQLAVRFRRMAADTPAAETHQSGGEKISFTREENLSIAIRLRMKQVEGFSLTPEQSKMQKELDVLCQGIEHPQLNPLKILYFEILTCFLQGRDCLKNNTGVLFIDDLLDYSLSLR